MKKQFIHVVDVNEEETNYAVNTANIVVIVWSKEFDEVNSCPVQATLHMVGGGTIQAKVVDNVDFDLQGIWEEEE